MSNKRHILFISFLFEPNHTVGAKRITYWAKNLSRINPEYSCDVISTVPNPNPVGIEDYMHIPNPKQPKGPIKDEGITWKKEIKQSILEKNKNYDVVVMSGSPFMYFSLTSFFQKRGSKVILDYRDPFANNPRFDNSVIKIKAKEYYESKFNKQADKILTVNQYCLELLSGYSQSNKKFEIIKNGYEDLPVEGNSNILSKSEVNFIYTGTFFADRNPNNLLDVIGQFGNHKFHHVGRETDIFNHSGINSYGLMPYSSMLSAIDESDICVSFSSGKPFESTTKIYDYIYRKKPIWIISNQEIKNGGIWDELKDYPKVVWSINDRKSIEKDLPIVLELINQNADIDVSPYSRKSGLLKLINLFEEIC